MKTPLKNFVFEKTDHLTNNVRVIQDKAWFVANDICNILEIVDVKQALARLDDDEREDYHASIAAATAPYLSRAITLDQSFTPKVVLTIFKFN